MIVVDSSVWINLINRRPTPQTSWLHSKRSIHEVCLTDLVLCEVLQGVRHDREAAAVRLRLEQFPIFASVGTEIAITAATNYRYLRAKGITIRKLADCLIATFCIENGHQLLHRDHDFDPFEKHLGLQVIHPARELQ